MEEKTTLQKGTPNKWKFLANRVMLTRGVPRRHSVKSLLENFASFVEYYSENKTVYKQRSKQRKSINGGQEAQAERTECAAPMTEVAFCVWLGMNRDWMRTTIYYLKNLENPSPAQSEYLDVLLRIRSFFEAQLVEGAILGEYTPQVVCSLLGIRNSLDVTSEGKPVSAPVINLIMDNRSREDCQRERDGLPLEVEEAKVISESKI